MSFDSVLVPSDEECELLMREFGVPDNIRRHSEAVRRVANFLGEKIFENGFFVNLALVDKGAWLHDLMKWYCIQNNCKHALKASEVLLQRGYSELAFIVKAHALTEVLYFDEKTCVEAKIVWYADKRVTHDKIVSLKERYDYLKKTYGSKSEKVFEEIVSTQKLAFELEDELFKMAGVSKDLGVLKC